MAASNHISENPRPSAAKSTGQISENPRPSAAKSTGRGGRRPGAGAPRGNMNALKHGTYSRQFAQVGALLAADPKVRETLLALGRRHNLQRQKANEVAALLLTRLFQRAEDVASGRVGPAHPERSPQRAVEGFQRAEEAAIGGLNLDLPADDRDSITIAAGQAARRQIRANIRRALRNRNPASINQTPDTTAPGQSPV